MKEYKTKDISFNICFDGSELTQFVEDNSELKWNDICDIENKIQLYDITDSIGSISYDKDIDTNVYTNENRKFYQGMINKFYEAYALDKQKSFIILFTN